LTFGRFRQDVIQDLTFPKSTQLEAKRVVAGASGIDAAKFLDSSNDRVR
jgi:hypothetical protein